MNDFDLTSAESSIMCSNVVNKVSEGIEYDFSIDICIEWVYSARSEL